MKIMVEFTYEEAKFLRRHCWNVLFIKKALIRQYRDWAAKRKGAWSLEGAMSFMIPTWRLAKLFTKKEIHNG